MQLLDWKRTVAFVLCFLCLIAPALAADAKPTTQRSADKPNVIFILADDLGWTDVACYGSKYYETPNIDRLASQGLLFTDAYTAAPNCAPTRAAINSGQYEPRTGIYTVGGVGRFPWQSRPLKPVDNITKMPLEKHLLSNAMKDAGYATAMFGKWHLGEDDGYHPLKRGFDDAFTSAGRHFNFKTNPPVDHPKDAYLADFLTDNAVRFITEHKDEPFYLYLPHFGVHAPYQAKQEYIEKFKNKPVPEGSGHNNPVYAAMIYSVDESVGRIMKTLDDLGLAENTLLIFSSDNGGVGGYAREGLVEKGQKGVTDNTPLRGGKGMLYEGGVRVPMIWRWPGHIAKGKKSGEPIISVDLYPTFVELAKSKPPVDYPLDGTSLVPLVTNKSPDATLNREALYWHFPGYLGLSNGNWRTLPGGAIRMGDYKLIEFFEDAKIELYNLKDDVSQQHNLADAQPDRAKAMQEKLHAWRESTGAKMPTKNEHIDPNAKPKKGKKNLDNDE